MILIDGRVSCESHVLTCDYTTLKNQAKVVKKIKFSDDERFALEAIDFDFDNLKQLVAKYGESKDESDLDNVKFASPIFLYFKQHKESADPVIVAVAVEGQIYFNKNVDDGLGAGSRASRFQYCAFLNGFADCFSATDTEVQTFDGATFKVEKSAMDDRRKKIKTDDGCLDW